MRAPLLYFFPNRADLPKEWHYRFKNSCTQQPGGYGPPKYNKQSRGFAATPFKDVQIIFDESLQNWTEIEPGVWLGIDKDYFSPTAFQKLAKPVGEPVYMADGRAWIIPCCNVDHEPDLPISQRLTPVKLDGDGMPQLRLKNTLYDEYADLGRFLKLFEDDILQNIIFEGKDSFSMGDLDIQIAITKALSINYAIDIRELSIAGVFGEEIYLAALNQMLNFDAFINDLKEKLKDA
tara:strand:+ start:2066 stop:2770 length:705 start_codon:yes stop_codon:yes gene_type:complete